MIGFVGLGYGLRILDRRKNYFDISGSFPLYTLNIRLLQRGPGWQVLWAPGTACGFRIGGKIILIYQAVFPYTDLIFARCMAL